MQATRDGPGSSAAREIFALAMPLADVAVVTEIDADFDGDTFAPRSGPDWHEVARERHSFGRRACAFSFVTYQQNTTSQEI